MRHKRDVTLTVSSFSKEELLLIVRTQESRMSVKKASGRGMCANIASMTVTPVLVTAARLPPWYTNIRTHSRWP